MKLEIPVDKIWIFFLQNIDSLQKAFITLFSPLELCGALFYDGWMHFIGFQKLDPHSLP